jgi:hypothetical protein
MVGERVFGVGTGRPKSGRWLAVEWAPSHYNQRALTPQGLAPPRPRRHHGAMRTNRIPSGRDRTAHEEALDTRPRVGGLRQTALQGSQTRAARARPSE